MRLPPSPAHPAAFSESPLLLMNPEEGFVTILARFLGILQAKGTIFCGILIFAPLGVLYPADRAGGCFG
jgi:hypothetical protein